MPVKSDISSHLLEERIANALKAWYLTGEGDGDLLADLLLVQETHQNSQEPHLPINRRTTNRVLTAALQTLERQNAELGQVLRLRFIEDEKLWSVANTLSISSQTVSRLQKKALQQLTALIRTQEETKRSQLVDAMTAVLPPASYTRLFGIEETGRRLLALLLDPDGPEVMALIGLGGLGKTALTDWSLRQAVQHLRYHRVIWLRVESQSLSGKSLLPELTLENLSAGLSRRIWPEQAEPMTAEQRLAALRQEFGRRPYLVVIDNLEEEANADYLIDLLHSFAGPTRFLLTSRLRLAEQSAVFNIPLQELPQAAAIAFIRYHAGECGIVSVVGAADQEIARIYEIAGGNPLALKLITSLLDVLPLSDILADFSSTHTDPIQNLYRHIYRKSWEALSENGRILLQAMPLVSESGGSPDYLMTVSGLEQKAFWPALQELHGRSLIEARGSIQDKRYGIHRLTNSFLSVEIVHLPEWL